MRTLLAILLLASLSFAQGLTTQGPTSQDSAAVWQNVGQIIGKAGTFRDGVYRIGLPRTDLDIHIGQTKIEPAAGLGSWMAFASSKTDTIADGDLVLTASEVNPVVSALQAGGIEVTAIHNHLIGEEPQVMYLHFFGKGKRDELAKTLKSALDATATPVRAVAAAVEIPPLPDQEKIEANMGKAGTQNGAVLSFSFPRTHMITMHYETMAPAMGMATAINFQRGPDGVAATGDFVVLEGEVRAVVAALRKGSIQVTAMHNHMLGDEPRMVFVHFWAEGTADAVSKALRSALVASTSCESAGVMPLSRQDVRPPNRDCMK